jgi:hypothetical protein
MWATLHKGNNPYAVRERGLHSPRMGAELALSHLILGQCPAALLMDIMEWISTRKHTYLNAKAEAAVVNSRPSFQPCMQNPPNLTVNTRS